VTVFVDTSALYALLDEGDANHRVAVQALSRLRGEELVTHAYVTVETLALVSRRLGWQAARRLIDGLLPVIEVHPVGEALHAAALLAYREAGSSRVSFVDRTSFAFMRANDLHTAWAFDADFARSGFERVR
jgi:predicted nucleic acid-binding protein